MSTLEQTAKRRTRLPRRPGTNPDGQPAKLTGFDTESAESIRPVTSASVQKANAGLVNDELHSRLQQAARILANGAIRAAQRKLGQVGTQPQLESKGKSAPLNS